MTYANLLKGREYEAILKALIYSDIFNFPLTKDEIWNFLIADKKIQRASFNDALEKLKGKSISEKEGYFCLKGQEKIIKNRKKHIVEVERKIRIAKKAASYLSHIPTIFFIGISGGLAMGDVAERDDIDFFVITKRNTLFKTRFIILFILELLGLRRKRLQKESADKICVNFLIDDTKLSFPSEKRDVYTAHEILQVLPLFERENTYAKFLEGNMWSKKFFPNAVKREEKIILPKVGILYKILSPLIIFLSPEWIFRRQQIKFMKKHITVETISKHVLAFNPNDYRVWTLNNLRLKFQKLGLLTKK